MLVSSQGRADGAEALPLSSNLTKTSPVFWELQNTTVLGQSAHSNSFRLSPKSPFQTTQVTLTHSDMTTGFDR